MTGAPPLVYALALVSAVFWGFGPVLDKRGMSAGGDPLQAALVVVVVDTSLYWLALFVRSWPVPFSGLTPRLVGIFAVAGLVGTALGRIFVFAGVDRVGASVNSAGISTRPLFAALLAVFFLGEPLDLVTAAGIVVLVAGLVTLTYSTGGDVEGWQPRDLLFPVGAAAVFAVGNVLRRFGFQNTGATPLQAVAVNETAALVGLGLYTVARHGTDPLDASRESYIYFLGSGLVTVVALLSFFAAFAMEAGRVAIVDPLAATAPLFTTVFAAAFLGDLEQVTRGIVAGAVLVVAGAVLITV